MANIILGTVQFGLDYGINNFSGKPGEQAVHEILEYAHASGIRSLDTADGYGNAAELIGSFHKKTGANFEVATKFAGVTDEGIDSVLQKSMEVLAVDHIQTYFYHSFSEYAGGRLTEKIDKFKKEKRVRSIGVSVYTNDELKTVIDDPAIDVIQLPYNLLDNTNQRGALLEKAKKAAKRVQVRSVFLQGLFFRNLQALPVFLLPLKPYLEKIHRIATQAGVTMESLCLQYVNAQPYIDEIIIGVDTKEQLQKNIRALEMPLDKSIIQKISGIQVIETSLLYPYNWK